MSTKAREVLYAAMKIEYGEASGRDYANACLAALERAGLAAIDAEVLREVIAATGAVLPGGLLTGEILDRIRASHAALKEAQG